MHKHTKKYKKAGETSYAFNCVGLHWNTLLSTAYFLTTVTIFILSASAKELTVRICTDISDEPSKGAHTLRAVLREAGRQAGWLAGFGKHGNTLQSTHWEQELEQASSCSQRVDSNVLPCFPNSACQLLVKLLSVCALFLILVTESAYNLSSYPNVAAIS